MAIILTADGTTLDLTNTWNRVQTGMTVDAVSGVLRFATSVTSGGSTSNRAYLTDKVGASRYNSEVVFKATRASAASALQVSLDMRTPGNDVYSHDAMWLEFVGSGAPTLYYGTTRTSLKTAAAGAIATTGTWYRLRLEDGVFYAKSWAVGASEPTTWNTTTDVSTRTTGPGRLWFHSYRNTSGTAQIDIDDVVLDDLAVASVNAGYTGEVITATAMMPTATVSITKPVTVVAQPMTASAAMPTASVLTNIRKVTVTDDTQTGPVSSSNYGTALTLAAGQAWWFKLPAVELAPDEAVVGARLVLTPTGSSGAVDYQVGRVTGDWSETGITSNNQPGTSLVSTQNKAMTTGTPVSFDISGVVTSANFGVRINSFGAGSAAVHSAEATTAANRPVVEYFIGSNTSVSVPAAPFTATAQMPETTTSTTSGASVGVQPMQASATLVDASVTAEQMVNVTVAAEQMDAFAEMPDALFSLPAGVVVEPMTATAEWVDASAGTTKGVVVKVTPMTAQSRWVRPDSVNGEPIIMDETEDPYFQRIAFQLPDTWLRLIDAGSTAKDRVTGNTLGTYIGVQTGQFEAPEGRHSVYFNGNAFIDTNESGDEINPTGDFALEFSFRTTKANAFLMIGQDTIADTGANVPGSAREVRLTGGKINFRQYRFGPGFTQTIDREFTGLRTINDGEWHTVVIRSTDATNNNIQGAGTEIWIDGTLEVRRYGVSPFVGFPDYIGGRPNYIEFGSDLPALPGSEWFVGDMSEIVFFSLSNLDRHTIPRDYYDFMGWRPIEADPMEAFAFTPAGSTGRGNQKRMLALTWGIGENDFYDRGPFDGNNKVNFDPLLGFSEGITDYAGYKVFGKSVTHGANFQPYRDVVTDEFNLIDLERDVNLREYDVLVFQDWPDEGTEIDAIEAEFPGQRERLIRQIRNAVDRGLNLMVTHPRLAVDLGIIDRVEFVPTLRELRFSPAQGNASGLYDYGSAYKFPWNVASSSGLIGAIGAGSPFNGVPVNRDPSFLAAKAFYFGDTNKNDRFRVRALIEGLTDIPSYMIQDAVFQVDYAQFGWSGVAYKYLHRLDGLRIGDEYLFHGSDFGMSQNWSSVFDYVVARHNGTYATPAANVKAGTVVTTFGAKHWNGTQEVDNPYRDYATTIVLEPGDNLNGSPIGARIFVNFTEQPSRQPEGVTVQKLPEGNVGWPAGYNPDTAEQREWEWSFTRKTLSSTATGGTEAVSFIDPLGNRVTINAPAGGADLAMVRSHNLFPLEAYPSYQMVRRGLFWLMKRDVVAEGANTQRVAPMRATAGMPNATVSTERDVTVRAEPFNALAVMPKVKEDTSGDADIFTLPMTASAKFSGYGKTIAAEPMTAYAEFIENLEAVSATGEQVVLTLHGFDATLYLKEEA